MTLKRIDCGHSADPWFGNRIMTEAPEIDPTSVVRASDFGRYTYFGPHSHMADSVFHDYAYSMGGNQISHADVGKFCNIATGVRINPSNHPWWRSTLHHITYRSVSYGLGQDDDAEIFNWRAADRVVIGPDVWIGHNAIVMPGVKIGAGAAIGSGSVVTKDVPPFAIVVGVPARVLRYRVDSETAERLQRIAWWDWSHEQLAEAMADFRRLNAAEFAVAYDV